MSTPVRINSAPGIQRDGTRFESQSYIDGQWCRFQRGKPQKMGGYQSIASSLPELVRGMNSFSASGLHYLHLGSATQLQQYTINNSGGLANVEDRTPAALVADSDNLWQFDVFYEAANVINLIIGHAAPNLSDIDSTTERAVWYGEVTDDAILTSTGIRSVSGGIVALGPYLFSFGNNGQIGFSGVNDPTTVTDAFITQQKIVKGLPLRGSGAGPAGLFWSLDSLIRASFVGGTAIWAFDTITSETSILSSQGVIEYDGVYYWPGVDRWLMFNGVVRDIPNGMNFNWFFKNLNYTHRQKVFAYKVPRFGEIWWCYPRGSATECTHAVIYNVKEQTWYDTQLPDTGRTAGVYAKVYRRPIMTGRVLTDTPGYTLWQHEIGTDRVDQSDVQPIPSHFETSEISMLTAEQAKDQSLHVARIEPDFVQSGNLTLQVRGRINPRAPIVGGEIFTFSDSAANGDQETVKLKEVRRLMSFKFSSNAIGGHYEMGTPLAHVEPADGRVQT